MKKVLGILALSCICIMLGLSVKWSRDKSISLISMLENTEISGELL